MTNEQKHLSKSAQVVQAVLAEKGVPFAVVELASSTRTAKEAAQSLGCEVGQIIKSLLFRSDKTNQPVLVLASGINRVDEKAIANLLGEAIVKADADFTREITGFAIGGVPPLGHKKKITHIFIDEDLFKFATCWAAAGTPNAVFSFPASALEHLTGGKIVAVKTL